MNGNPPKPHCGVDPVQPAHRRAHASWHASWGSNKALYAMPVYESWPTHQVCLTFAIRNLPSTTKTDTSLHKRRSECGHSSRCMQLRRTPNKAHPQMLLAMHGQHSCELSGPTATHHRSIPQSIQVWPCSAAPSSAAAVCCAAPRAGDARWSRGQRVE